MSTSLKIGILGTRGIPNRYGGFEQCAEYLALGLKEKGHRVWVYNSEHHEYKGDKWKGVHIVHCKDPEDKMGTFGQFIYDLNCIKDSRKRDFDILLQLGYTSNSIWYWRWPRKVLNIVNMDGLEWKRSKYNKYVRRFLKYAEKLAAKHADEMVADSVGIQQYLKEQYNKPSTFIAYGADIFDQPEISYLANYALEPYKYHMLMARMEPENNIEMIIKGHLLAGMQEPLLVIGKTDNAYGTYLKETYGSNVNVCFLGGIYDTAVINNLRYYSHIYFHGHTVGGTNPSLIEAMGTRSLIAANNNAFNKGVLGEDAFYFADDKEVSTIIKQAQSKNAYAPWLENNIEKIKKQYNWPKIVDDYEALFLKSIRLKK